MSLLESKVDHQCFMTPSITYTCHRCAPNITVFPLASTVSAMGKQRPPSWFGTMTVKKKKSLLYSCCCGRLFEAGCSNHSQSVKAIREVSCI